MTYYHYGPVRPGAASSVSIDSYDLFIAGCYDSCHLPQKALDAVATLYGSNSYEMRQTIQHESPQISAILSLLEPVLHQLDNVAPAKSNVYCDYITANHTANDAPQLEARLVSLGMSGNYAQKIAHGLLMVKDTVSRSGRFGNFESSHIMPDSPTHDAYRTARTMLIKEPSLLKREIVIIGNDQIELLEQLPKVSSIMIDLANNAIEQRYGIDVPANAVIEAPVDLLGYYLASLKQAQRHLSKDETLGDDNQLDEMIEMSDAIESLLNVSIQMEHLQGVVSHKQQLASSKAAGIG